MTTSNAEQLPERSAANETVSIEELARQQGVRPIGSIDELALPGAFESDEDWQEFLEDLYASRHAGMA